MAVSDQNRVTHIVLFRYHPSVPWTDLEHHFADLAKLKSTCLKPAGSGKPYMLSMQMGKNHSWENFGKGMTHAIVLEFASVEDRDFYLLEDPVHRAFSVSAAPLIEDSVVVGEFHGHSIRNNHSGPFSILTRAFAIVRLCQWLIIRPFISAGE